MNERYLNWDKAAHTQLLKMACAKRLNLVRFRLVHLHVQLVLFMPHSAFNICRINKTCHDCIMCLLRCCLALCLLPWPKNSYNSSHNHLELCAHAHMVVQMYLQVPRYSSGSIDIYQLPLPIEMESLYQVLMLSWCLISTYNAHEGLPRIMGKVRLGSERWYKFLCHNRWALSRTQCEMSAKELVLCCQGVKEVEQRIMELAVLVPDLMARLGTMKADILIALLEDTEVILAHCLLALLASRLNFNPTLALRENIQRMDKLDNFASGSDMMAQILCARMSQDRSVESAKDFTVPNAVIPGQLTSNAFWEIIYKYCWFISSVLYEIALQHVHLHCPDLLFLTMPHHAISISFWHGKKK